MTVAPPARTDRIRGARDVELACDLWDGRRRGFLLAHGLASNARMWDGVASALAVRGHAVAALDLRGHGRSGKPHDGYDLATFCADVASVLERLAATEGECWRLPILVGQSFGGNLALELATTRPDLLGGAVGVDGGMIDLHRWYPEWASCAAALAPPRLTDRTAAELETLIRSSCEGWPEAGIQGMLANFDIGPDGSIAPWLTFDRHMALLRALWEQRPRTLYDLVQVPMLLVPAGRPGAGFTADRRVDVDVALASLPCGGVRWFPDAGHDIHAQDPLKLASVLLDELEGGILAGCAA